MGDRTNVHAENLLGAGKLYGDAKLAAEQNPYSPGTLKSEAIGSAFRQAEVDLHSAARAYATRMRRKAKAAPPSVDGKTKGEGNDG